MREKTERTKLAAALRDFFIAEKAADLERPYQTIEEAAGASLPAVTDWQEVEFAFNRLFVGPKAPEAPPFASVYLDPEPQVMGPTTILVRQTYAMIGLVSPWKNSLPDDHVSLELDAALAMRLAAEHSNPDELDKVRTFFVAEHMTAWIPAFTQKTITAESAHPAITAAAELTRKWVEAEAALLQRTTEPIS